MTDFRKIYEEGCCTTSCNTVRTCMCALAEDMADEIERLQSCLYAQEDVKPLYDEIERLQAELDKAHRLCGQFIGWQRDLYIKLAQQEAEIEQLTALLRDALPFVNDAGDDEDPEAKTAATEIAENIRRALEQARKE